MPTDLLWVVLGTQMPHLQNARRAGGVAARVSNAACMFPPCHRERPVCRRGIHSLDERELAWFWRAMVPTTLVETINVYKGLVIIV